MKLLGIPFASAFLILGLTQVQPALGAEREPYSIDQDARAAVVERSIAILEETYVFPEVAGQMALKLRTRMAAGEYASMTSAVEFARTLTADLREVSNDKHLRVNYLPFGVPGEPPAGPQVENVYVPSLGVGMGFGKAEILEGNIGYVDIRAFHPPKVAADAASQAMNSVADADVLIIDLRRNRGGWPDMVAYVLSYVFDVPTHVNDMYERAGDKTTQYWTSLLVPGARFGGQKPIYVLTSKETFSGGEELAYDLKALGRAILVGETTAGGAHPTRPEKAVAGFVVFVPFGRAINPITQSNWEGVGVTPDVPAAADDAFDVACRLAKERTSWYAASRATLPKERDTHRLDE